MLCYYHQDLSLTGNFCYRKCTKCNKICNRFTKISYLYTIFNNLIVTLSHRSIIRSICRYKILLNYEFNVVHIRLFSLYPSFHKILLAFGRLQENCLKHPYNRSSLNLFLNSLNGDDGDDDHFLA